MLSFTLIVFVHTQELSCVEKYKRYGQEAKDPVLRDLFADLEKKEQKHVESLEQVMKGSVPSCNVNDRDGKMYEPKATYDSMTNPEDKKNDNFLATDSIGSEKMVSASIIADAESVTARVSSGSGNVRITLKDMKDRDYTQMEVAEQISKAVQKKTKARSFVQQSSSFGGRRGGMPVQYVLQATNIEKLQKVLPVFMAKVYENPVFQMADVNLKFSKPEARININRDKASIMGVSTRNIAQTLQYGLSGQRMGYFYIVTTFEGLLREEGNHIQRILADSLGNNGQRCSRRIACGCQDCFLLFPIFRCYIYCSLSYNSSIFINQVHKYLASFTLKYFTKE